jgi:hypothetical protein
MNQFVLLLGFFGSGLAGFIKFVKCNQVIGKRRQFCKRCGPVFFQFNGPEYRFSFPGVVPKTGILGFLFFAGYFFDLSIDVKDASSVHACALKCLLIGRM